MTSFSLARFLTISIRPLNRVLTIILENQHIFTIEKVFRVVNFYGNSSKI